MTSPEIAIAVLIGLALLLQGLAGWLSFVAHYEETVVRAGSKDASYELNGRLVSDLAVNWGDDKNEQRWPFRLTTRWFGVASSPSTPVGEPDLPYVHSGARIGARGIRFVSYALAGGALYVGFIFDTPVLRVLS